MDDYTIVGICSKSSKSLSHEIAIFLLFFHLQLKQSSNYCFISTGIFSFPLKYLRVSKKRFRPFESLYSLSKSLILSNTSLRISMMKEVMMAPKSIKKEPISRSEFDLGVQSPSPTVDRVVKKKYVRTTTLSLVFSSSKSKCYRKFYYPSTSSLPKQSSLTSQKMYQPSPIK